MGNAFANSFGDSLGEVIGRFQVHLCGLGYQKTLKNTLWSESSLLWNTGFWKIGNVQGSGQLALEQKYQR